MHGVLEMDCASAHWRSGHMLSAVGLEVAGVLASLPLLPLLPPSLLPYVSRFLSTLLPQTYLLPVPKVEFPDLKKWPRDLLFFCAWICSPGFHERPFLSIQVECARQMSDLHFKSHFAVNHLG